MKMLIGSGERSLDACLAPGATATLDEIAQHSGFTVERDVTWFRYADIPAPFRQAIAAQLGVHCPLCTGKGVVSRGYLGMAYCAPGPYPRPEPDD